MVKTQPIPRRGWPVSGDAVIARMDRAEASGQYDRTAEGLRRSREGEVNGAMMMCHVATLGTDTLLIFWDLEDGHQRRLLVDGAGKIWMDFDGRALVLRDNNKYFAVCAAVLRARAH